MPVCMMCCYWQNSLDCFLICVLSLCRVCASLLCIMPISWEGGERERLMFLPWFNPLACFRELFSHSFLFRPLQINQEQFVDSFKKEIEG